MKAILAALALTLATSAAHAGDPSHPRNVARQRFALALALTQAYDAGAICDANAYPGEIVREVDAAKSIAEDGELETFLATLNPGSAIHRNLAFREAIGRVNLYREDLTEAELVSALTGTVFYHFGQGAYGSGYNVTLEANGRAHERILEVLNEEPWSRWSERDTTWSVVRTENSSYGRWNLKVGAEEFRLDRHEEGALWWVPVQTKEGETDYQRTLSTSDAYCDA